MSSFRSIAFVLVSLGAVAMACGSGATGSGFKDGNKNNSGGDDDASVENPSFDEDSGTFGDVKPPCTGLKCKQVDCPAGQATTVTGKVYTPDGKLPIYNVIVYVPNAPLDPIPSGATCDQCAATASGQPIVTALTDAKGEFKLENVPVGADIPLVIQVGKWRRELTITNVDACKTTQMPDKSVRLPRNQSEGNIPRMAITTGGWDPLPCLFSRIGLDPAEFTRPDGNGRMHVYKGEGDPGFREPGDVVGGGAPKPEAALWNNLNTLKSYDMVILSCEGSEHNETKSAQDKERLRDYLWAGGRAFATHYHYTWFKNGPSDISGIANWTSGGFASGDYHVDTSFPKGKDFADWLALVTGRPHARIPLTGVANDLSSVGNGSQRWIHMPASPEAVKYFTFNTPVGVPTAQQCGRGVFSDIHVAGSLDQTAIPTSCGTTELTEQEKALVFLYFDLSACIQNEKEPPKPPPPR